MGTPAPEGATFALELTQLRVLLGPRRRRTAINVDVILIGPPRTLTVPEFGEMDTGNVASGIWTAAMAGLR
jgi:hypothetical protein